MCQINDKQMNKFLLIMAIIFGLASCSSDSTEDYDDDATFLPIGTAAPIFTLTPLGQEDAVSLNRYRGSYVFIELWRASCPDCRSVTSRVKQLYEQYSAEGVVFMGISFDKDKTVWKNYVESNGLSWLQFHDDNMDTSESLKLKFNCNWVPTFYLIDKDGTVKYRTTGITKISDALEKLISGEEEQ